VLYSIELFNVVDIAFVKFSISALLSQSLQHRPKVKVFLWAIFAFLAIWSLEFILVMTFQCTPISFFWTRAAGTVGKCVNATTMYAVNAGIHILTDLFLYIFPMPFIWKLHTSTSKKLGILVVFMAGGLYVEFFLLE
jgi:hypothetical protein